MILEGKQYFSSNKHINYFQLSTAHKQGILRVTFTVLIALMWVNVSLFAQSVKTVNIKADNGFYLSLNPNIDFFVKAYQEQPGEWETFTVKTLGDSTVIRGFNGKYITLNTTYGSLQGNSDTAHYFQFTEVKPGQFIIKTETEYYLGAESDQFVYTSRRTHEKAGIFYLETTVPHKASSYLSSTDNAILAIAFGLIILSLIAFIYKRERMAIWVLILGALLLRIFMATVANYLHLWDEQYHALVAKNMINNPFTPMLYANPLLPYPLYSWIEGHIWLHKQPLFLWQMAASMTLFGVNLLAMRLPSILMSTAIVWFIYVLGVRMVDKKTGFYAAFLFAVGNYGLQLVNGYHSTDHNDVAFHFYVTASIVAWVIYWQNKRSLKWALLIGLLSGMAVMVKWIPGVLVYAGWGAAIIFTKEQRKTSRAYLHFAIAVIVTAVVVIPWQLYTLHYFPEIATHELLYNSAHVGQAVEQHGGDWRYHFNMSKYHFGIPFLLLLTGWILMIKQIKSNGLNIAVSIWIISVFTVFTIAQTKMPTFTFMIAALSYLGGARLLVELLNIIIINPNTKYAKHLQTLFTVLVIGFIGWRSVNYKAIQARHTLWNKSVDDPYKNRILTQRLIKSLEKDTDNETVFFYMRSFDNIPLMFFTDAAAAYDRMLTESEIELLISKGYRLRTFDDGNLPDYIYSNDIEIIKNYWHPL